MAPTINKTKLVATAIATFASTDKLIIFPAIMAAIPITPVFEFFLFLIVSNFTALMDARRSVRRTKNGAIERSDPPPPRLRRGRHRTRRDRGNGAFGGSDIEHVAIGNRAGRRQRS